MHKITIITQHLNTQISTLHFNGDPVTKLLKSNKQLSYINYFRHATISVIIKQHIQQSKIHLQILKLINNSKNQKRIKQINIQH